MIETYAERLYRLYNVDCRITAEGVMEAYKKGLITYEEAEWILGANFFAEEEAKETEEKAEKAGETEVEKEENNNESKEGGID